jgi:hypothetical protein
LHHSRSKSNNRVNAKKDQKGSTRDEGPNHSSTTVKTKKTHKDGTAKKGGKRPIRGGLTIKEKCPLSPAKTRTNVRKDPAALDNNMGPAGDRSLSGGTTAGPGGAAPAVGESENLRRKTRSSAAGKRLNHGK